MTKPLTGIFCVLAALFLITQPTFAGDPKDKTITIEGQAAGTNANAMEQAKQDALRKAVQQACGSFINSMTQAKNYTAIYDKCMESAAGYVNEYEIVDRHVDNGISFCKVKANVSTKSFESEWTRLAHTVAVEGNPRVVMVVLEDNNADDQRLEKNIGVVQSGLENFFLKHDVQLMDKGAGDDMRQRDMNLAAQNNDAKKMAAMGASMKADVVVQGNAEAREAGVTQLAERTLYKWKATISIRVFHTDSAQMLMSNSYTTTATSINPNNGGDDALKKCAEENAGNILRDIGEAWRKRQNVRRICQITIENMSRKDYKEFEAALKDVDGVQDVKLRELVNNTCQIEVEWSYDLERLVARIEELKVGDMAFEASEQTHDRATFKTKR